MLRSRRIGAMRDVELYRSLLGLSAPWTVVDVEVDMKGQRVVVRVDPGPGPYPCPKCGTAAPRYDSKPRRWHHLDTAGKEAEITEQTYDRWRKEYGGVKLEEARRLRELEKENGRLKSAALAAGLPTARAASVSPRHRASSSPSSSLRRGSAWPSTYTKAGRAEFCRCQVARSAYVLPTSAKAGGFRRWMAYRQYGSL
jgi:hypothetical protein